MVSVVNGFGSEQVSITSVVFSQSELIQNEVFLVGTVDSLTKEVMAYLKSVFFLRPITENIQHLKRHLSNLRFGFYHLYFSNILKTHYLQILGDSNEHEVVQQVKEFYTDFAFIDPCYFKLNMPSNYIYMLSPVADHQSTQFFSDRVCDGISVVILELKQWPIIRYQWSSDIARRIAEETTKLMYFIKVPKDQEEVVLSLEKDTFLRKKCLRI